MTPDPRAMHDAAQRQQERDQAYLDGYYAGAAISGTRRMTPEPILTPRGKRRAPLRAGEGRVWAAIAGAAAVFILFNLGA